MAQDSISESPAIMTAPRVELPEQPADEEADAAAPAANALGRSAERWPMVLVAIGIGIFVINMLGAWLMVYRASEFVQRIPGEHQGAVAVALEQAGNADLAKARVLQRVVETEIHSKVLANEQMLMFVAMAAAFAMMAIGFALFIVGVRGAFQLSGNLVPSAAGRFVLSSGSPGILCMVLAAVLLFLVLVQDTSVTFTPTSSAQKLESAQRSSEGGIDDPAGMSSAAGRE